MDQTKIYDIAGLAGVSLATVSRVSNHPEKVKKATRDRVLKIIKEQAYKPNANARGLASRKSTTVAVVVPTLKRASIGESIQGIDDSAKQYGYTIRLFINDEQGDEKDLWSEVIASSVDGILFMNDEMSDYVFSLIENTPVPIVFVNAISKNKKFGSVSIDNVKCAYEVTKQMIEKGNKEILFVTTTKDYAINDLKVQGYEKAMKEAGLTPEVFKSTGVLTTNEQQYKEYLSKKIPDVALVVRDSMAISFMNTATNMGIKVPEQLQVIGFQNTRYALLSNPQLTCVDNPVYEVGSLAMSKLTELMSDTEDTKPERLEVSYNIQWRGSTK